MKSSKLEEIFGKSHQIREVIKQIHQVSRSNFSVLLEGETGVGKTLVARTIHALSKRREKPFVKVEIGSIPDTLFESELFGYKKGAFTCADRDKKGFFEAANGGTLFVDELENMTPCAQGKLLRAMEERQVVPLSSITPIDIDVRIISATNNNIKQEVKDKEFREDLFYRLCEFDILTPPLRERKEDIAFLARQFLVEAADELDKEIKGISGDVLDILQQHPWPGNVRELKNVIRKAALQCEHEQLALEDMQYFFVRNSDNNREMQEIDSLYSSFPFTLRIAVLEEWAIRQALVRTKGRQMKAAALLGIDYQRFKRKLEKYEILP
jgi:transcriptional regulator with PAS, ATPase and Fis domain